MTTGHVKGLAEEKGGRLTLPAISISVPSSHLEQRQLSMVEAEKTKWTHGLSKNFQSQSWPS